MTDLEKQARVAELSLGQVTKYCQQENFSRAFPHYLVFAQLEREKFSRDHVGQFLSVTSKFVQQLRSIDPSKILTVYEEALKLLPNNSQLLTSYGTHLFLMGDKMKEAEAALRAAVTADPQNIEAKDKLENLCSTLLERRHFPMLNDRLRNSRYQAAINNLGKSSLATSNCIEILFIPIEIEMNLVTFGHFLHEIVPLVSSGFSSVLDLGTGTGLLSLMASKAGAVTVFACESSEVMVATAKDVLLTNQESNVRLIAKMSTDMDSSDIPERLSLLVTETFDSGLLGEHVLQSLRHAIENFMAPDFRVLPRAANFYIVPIQSKNIRDSISCCRDSIGYLSCNNLRVMSDMTSEGDKVDPYLTEDLATSQERFKFLSEPQRLFSVDFQSISDIQNLIDGKLFCNEFTADLDGECDAVAGYFSLVLDEDNVISTQPDNKSCWDQVIFPVTTLKKTVYKKSRIQVKCLVKKHIALESISIEHDKLEVNGNGSHDQQGPTEDMLVSPLVVRQLNSDTRAGVLQWLSYYVARDIRPKNVLDLTQQFPDAALQILKLCHEANLTIRVNPSQTRWSRELLDLVTALARQNDVRESRLDCVTCLAQSGETYEVVMVAPVSHTGRLDQQCLLDMAEVSSLLTTSTQSLILPASLQVWCVLISSRDLLSRSRLVSDEAVLGFKICEQVNVLSVSHQQELLYSGLEKTELCEPLLVCELPLASISLDRESLTTCVDITQSGDVHAILYWFVQDFGWNLKLSTLESEEFRQAAVLLQEKISVNTGDSVSLSTLLEAGLIDFNVQPPQ